MNITVNTQSSIRIESDKVYYFDPIEIKEERHDADFIFVTHEHFDHFSIDTIKNIEKEDTIYVIPDNMYQLLGGENVICLNPNETADVDGVHFETVPSYNNTKQFHPKDKENLGYIVTIENKRVYIMGDCDTNEDNLKVNADIILIPIGGKYTFDYKEATDYINQVKPELVIPTHYGGIVGKKDDGEKFKELIDKDINVEIKL